MADPARLTPLAHRASVLQGSVSRLDIAEVSDRAMIDLRLRPGDGAALEAAAAALGFALPSDPRSSAGTGSRQALWLSIDQWLVTCPLAGRDSLTGALEARLAGHVAAVTDLSDARAVIRLSGNGVDEVLMKGAPADLAGTALHAGSVRRIPLAGIPTIAHVVGRESDVTDLYIDRSYADAAWDWLLQASRQSAAVRLFTRQPPPPV